MTEEHVLSVPEACALIGMGKTKFWQLLWAGDIPHVRNRRWVGVPRAALDALAALYRYVLRFDERGLVDQLLRWLRQLFAPQPATLTYMASDFRPTPRHQRAISRARSRVARRARDRRAGR